MNAFWRFYRVISPTSFQDGGGHHFQPHFKQAFWLLLILIPLSSFFLASCSQREDGESQPLDETLPEDMAETVVEEMGAAENGSEGSRVPFEMMPGGYLERAVAGEFAGKVVSMDANFEEIPVNNSMAVFEELTCIKVNYFGNLKIIDLLLEGNVVEDGPDVLATPLLGSLKNLLNKELW